MKTKREKIAADFLRYAKLDDNGFLPQRTRAVLRRAPATESVASRPCRIDGVELLAVTGVENDVPSVSRAGQLSFSHQRPLLGTQVRAADSIVEALVEMGVDTFFGIPGGPVSPIFDAILSCPGARLIESRHETGAAFAAAGYYRASGRVPCVVVTAGPGQWLPETKRTNSEWSANFADIAKSSSRRELVDVDDLATCRAEEIALKYMAAEADNPFLGATERRVADAAMTAPEAEALAATAALDDAGISPVDVDVILSWAAAPERVSPPSAPKVAPLIGAINAYGVGTDAARASTVTQIEFAAALIESGRAKNVLLTQSHLMTRLFKLIHPVSPTVGDGATALVITACEQSSIYRTG